MQASLLGLLRLLKATGQTKEQIVEKLEFFGKKVVAEGRYTQTESDEYSALLRKEIDEAFDAPAIQEKS